MRRQDIQLLAAARAGDIDARCEVGRRYLLGSDGFPHHTATGREYLTHESMRGNACAQRALAEALPVHELLAAELLETVESAARAACVPAQLKAAACHLISPEGWPAALAWLESATRSDDAAAQRAWALAQGKLPAVRAAAAVFQSLADSGLLDAVAVLTPALRRARGRGDLDTLLWCLQLAQPWLNTQPNEVAEFVVDAIALSEERGLGFSPLPAVEVERALEYRVGQGDLRAAYQFGRALAGLPCGAVNAEALVVGGNLRKATALLLRAADGGLADAWMHLYRLSSDHRCSVANPQMARFFLEKSATSGNAEAQRRLATLLLRQSEDATHREQAMQWLHSAGSSGDEVAQALMASMVLPVAGDDAAAEAAQAEVQRADPWLAARLAVARCFGLTRQEALSFNPALGMRAWGLLVTQPPSTLPAAAVPTRAIPAVSHKAMSCLREAASLFARLDLGNTGGDGDPRSRTRALRTLMLRHGIDESLFFARATPNRLETLRRGPRWAASAPALVRMALQEAA